MRHRYHVDPVTGWGEVRLQGDVTQAHLRTLLEAIWQDPAFSRIEHAVWNLVDAHTGLDLDDLLSLNAWIREHRQGRGGRYVAIVAPQDLMFGISRMFDAVNDTPGQTVRVFRADEDARAWLRSCMHT